ncbi:hypothetical protein RSAG8_13706, partial [Rhizoctonia solani AG-8 WAC10335]
MLLVWCFLRAVTRAQGLFDGWYAPEMLVTPIRTKQADVYALGMTILEIFTGDVPYSDCRADFSVMMTVAQGTLPTRPMSQLPDDQRGNLVWRLLLNCWSRNLDERPYAGQVVETLESHAGEVQ